MGKLAIVATIKTVPGKREEYLKHMKAHAQRYLATERGTLKFDILVPLDKVIMVGATPSNVLDEAPRRELIG